MPRTKADSDTLTLEPTSLETTSLETPKAASKKTITPVCVIYYPDREKPRVQWVAGNPDVASVRHREIAIESNGEFKTINFIPGPNFDVDPVLWAIAKKQDATKQKINDGALKEYVPIDPNQADNSLGYSVSDVESIISTMYEVETLKFWQQKDNRPEVYKLIERRTQELGF